MYYIHDKWCWNFHWSLSLSLIYLLFNFISKKNLIFIDALSSSSSLHYTALSPSSSSSSTSSSESFTSTSTSLQPITTSTTSTKSSKSTTSYLRLPKPSENKILESIEFMQNPTTYMAILGMYDLSERRIREYPNSYISNWKFHSSYNTEIQAKEKIKIGQRPIRYKSIRNEEELHCQIDKKSIATYGYRFHVFINTLKEYNNYIELMNPSVRKLIERLEQDIRKESTFHINNKHNNKNIYPLKENINIGGLTAEMLRILINENEFFMKKNEVIEILESLKNYQYMKNEEMNKFWEKFDKLRMDYKAIERDELNYKDSSTSTSKKDESDSSNETEVTNEIMIVFRGTQSNIERDTNFDREFCSSDMYIDESICTTRKIQHAYESFRKEILHYLWDAHKGLGPNILVTFAGHSLGGTFAGMAGGDRPLHDLLNMFGTKISFQVITVASGGYANEEYIKHYPSENEVPVYHIIHQSDWVQYVLKSLFPGQTAPGKIYDLGTCYNPETDLPIRSRIIHKIIIFIHSLLTKTHRIKFFKRIIDAIRGQYDNEVLE